MLKHLLVIALVALTASVASACPVAIQSSVMVAAPQVAYAIPQVAVAAAPACACQQVAVQQQAVQVQAYAVPQVVQSYAVPLAIAAPCYSSAFAFNSVGYGSVASVNVFRARAAVQVNVAGAAHVREHRGLFGGTVVRIR
jgi:hypothetical protein